MNRPVYKGHATENDFVVIDDRDGTLSLSADLVRALCDRRSGIGADGVLRVVRSSLDPDSAAMANEAPFFMDYRNADGSIAEMCGNGARLFLRYLQTAGLVGDRTAIATRGGVRRAWIEPNGEYTVEMGRAQLLPVEREVRTVDGGPSAVGVAVTVPNPHVVVMVSTEADLARLDLSQPPSVLPPLPDGQNVEFVVTLGARHLAMRVNERGVGETRSCGTGICAAVVAMAAGEADDSGSSVDEPWLVDVPGGRCTVRLRVDGEVLLTGPAVLVGEVQLSEGWRNSVAAVARA